MWSRAALLAASLAACSGEPAAPAPCRGGWHVCGGHLRDASGRAAILRGGNVGKKQPPYLDYHQAADFDLIRSAWGMNAIRFFLPWAAVEPARGAYDDAYLAQVRQRLDWAGAAGLDVVLDLHQDVYGEGFGFDGAPRWTCDEARYAAFVPVEPWQLAYLDPGVQACFDELWTDPAKGAAHAAVWARIAGALADHPAVIGFDVINEPHWGSYDLFAFEHDRLQSFYDRDVAAVRAVAPHWVAFLEPAGSRNLGFATTLEPFAYPDVVYAPHAYDVRAEQGEPFDEERRRAFVDDLAALRGEADRLGAALWIGEYGGRGTDPNVGAYMDAAYDGAGAVAASSMYWEFTRGGGYAARDADGEEVTAITGAIVRPYPSRIAGDPVDWVHDEAARTLTVRYRPEPRVTAPTELIVPPRLAAAPGVRCDGCRHELAGDVVRITAPPAVDGDGVATVVITLD